ncbi:MAG: tRNA pseudouridine(38-40) synthase TruA [Leptospirales bacterium]|nr:tRNA pseudouridine(38-40) synthase TruA [Leptospirales bacterium]
MALLVEYDGSQFAGFQLQEGLATVQGELERALAVALRYPVRVSCSGRTDAGVHASGQVAAFDAQEPVNSERLRASLNALLPEGIAVHCVSAAAAGWHPRYDCIAREYEYLFWCGPAPSALWRRRALWLKHSLPIVQLNSQLEAILGERDFAALTRYEYRNSSTTRYLHRAQLQQTVEAPMTAPSGSLVVLRIVANAFLHNMIRILAGSLADISQGKIQINLAEIVASGNRMLAGRTAPPHALYLRRAIYRSSCRLQGFDLDDQLPDRRPRSALAALDHQP